MFQVDKVSQYEEAYQDLLARLGEIDLGWWAEALGGVMVADELALDVLGRRYYCSSRGIREADGSQPHITLRIVLGRYILQGGTAQLLKEWVSYREFRDGAFFMPAFQSTVEEPLAAAFSGRLAELEAASRALGGQPAPELPGGDVRLQFPALPNVPLALVFYDADDELPASARILFDAHSPFFLDLECLAVLGLILCNRLQEEQGRR